MFSVKKSNLFHFLSIVSILAGSLFMGLIIGILLVSGGTASPYFILAFSQLVLVFGPVLIYLLTQKGFWKYSLFKKSPGFVNLILAILLTWFLIPTVSLLNLISLFFVKNQIAETIVTLTDYPYLSVILVLAIFPGVFEELSTRFILLNNYRYKNYFTACLVSGLFFGLLHLNINQFIYAFVLGVVFCFVVMITESIYTSIAMHITLNATTFSISYFFMQNNPEAFEQAASADLWMEVLSLAGVNLITIPIAYLILRFLIKYNGKVSILKQKPTVLELTLGRKFAVLDANAPISWIHDRKGRPIAALPASQTPVYPAENIPAGGYPGQDSLPGAYSPAPQPAFPAPYPYAQPNPAFSDVTDTVYAVEQESIDIYLAKYQSPFNWAFWASIGLFVVLVFIGEVAGRFMPQ